MKDEKPLPPPCEVHELEPHDHSWHPPKFTGAVRCSGRFWCPQCERWFGGENCRLPVARAA